MASTGWKYPNNVYTQNTRTPVWQNTDNVEGQAPWAGAAEGGSISGKAKADTVNNVAPYGYSDRIMAGEYGFDIPINSRVDGVTARILRAGVKLRDNVVRLEVSGSYDLKNMAQNQSRSDQLLRYQTYGSSTNLWGDIKDEDGMPTNLIPALFNNNEILFKHDVHNIDDNSHDAFTFVMGLNVEYTNPTYSLTSSLPPIIKIDDIFSFNIVIDSTNEIGYGEPILIPIELPSNLTLINYEYDYDMDTIIDDVWYTKLSDFHSEITITCQATSLGTQSMDITEQELGTTINKSIEVVETEPVNIVKCDALINDETTLTHLEDGEWYAIGAYNKVVDAGISGIYPGISNNKISVINGDETKGERVTSQNAFQRVGITFQYDNAEPLTIRLYGQYQAVSTQGTDEWAGFTIKKGNDKTYSERGNLLADPDALLENASYSVLTLPSAGVSAEYSYTFDPVPEQDGAYPYIKGLTLNIDIDGRAGSGIEAQIVNSLGAESEVKTKNWTDDDAQIVLGDTDDLWGLTNEDIYGQTLTLILKFTNITLSEITPEYKNITLTLEWQDDETHGAMGLTINGVHSRNYGLYLTKADIPEGPTRDMETLDLPGLDGVLPTSQTLGALEYSIEFKVWGDTIQEAKEKLALISQWMANQRDANNRPITNEMIFDFDPERVYHYIMTDQIDVEHNYALLECTANLTAPIGVAMNLEPTETGGIGANNGIIKVRPVITVLADGSASIVLTDAITDQTVTINHQFTSGDVVTVDCENRTVTDQNETDYTSSVNINSVWFNIFEDYDISSTGGIVTGVSYTEGT